MTAADMNKIDESKYKTTFEPLDHYRPGEFYMVKRIIKYREVRVHNRMTY